MYDATLTVKLGLVPVVEKWSGGRSLKVGVAVSEAANRAVSVGLRIGLRPRQNALGVKGVAATEGVTWLLVQPPHAYTACFPVRIVGHTQVDLQVDLHMTRGFVDCIFDTHMIT